MRESSDSVETQADETHIREGCSSAGIQEGSDETDHDAHVRGLKAGGRQTGRMKERGSEKSGERSVPYGEEPCSGEEHALASDDICDAAEQ